MRWGWGEREEERGRNIREDVEKGEGKRKIGKSQPEGIFQRKC